MDKLPKKLYRSAQVREMDRRLIEDKGIPGYTLMCRAGDAVFHAIKTRWPKARRFLVLAGAGNNGGDGYVVARLALENGLQVSLVQLGDSGRIRGDAAHARNEYLDAGGCEITVDDAISLAVDVIVDAILGTGLERDVSDVYLKVISDINANTTPVVAVDVPSGLNADTGQVMGAAIRADTTVTFIGLKQGLFTGRAPDYCGEILYDALQQEMTAFQEVEAEIETATGLASERIVIEDVIPLLPRRARSCYKNKCGHVLVIGGNQGMPGSVRLTGEAALRAGAGLVTIATHKSHAAMIPVGRPELMCFPVTDKKSLEPLLQRADVIAIGPGLGQDEWASAIFDAAVAAGKPMVADADALNLLAKDKRKHNDWVLTPHPAEAARLSGCKSVDIQNDRFESVRRLAKEFRAHIVLKGVGTLVQSADVKNTRTLVCTDGNPGMATAGMGDVLTGIIAALIGQGVALDDAAMAGVWIHAQAADIAAGNNERGLIASDLFSVIRGVINPR